MTKRVISTPCIGLIFLGLGMSLCLGMEEYIPQLTDPSDNRQNLRLMQVIQQYASRFNVDNESGDEEAGTRRKRSGIQDTNIQKQEIGDDSIGEYAEYSSGKRDFPSQKNMLHMVFKNRPGFRSWGGKRSKFVTWGGKRFAPEIHRFRKSKFNNWGGKRSILAEDDLERRFEEKRDTFRSWGGKREAMTLPTLRTGLNSHSKFSNWGGKRFDVDEHTSEKRDMEYVLPYEQDDGPETEAKRGEFQSWGGKRLDKIGDSYINENIVGMNCLLRQYVNSILNVLQSDRRIGKKNIIGNRPLEDVGDFHRSGFSAWRGRR